MSLSRIKQFCFRTFSTLDSAAITLGIFALIGQIFGLFRDRLLASRIGPGIELDMYNAAFIVPDIIFAVGASLVSIAVVLPYVRSRMSDNEVLTTKAKTLLDDIFTVFLLFIVLTALVVGILAPQIAPNLLPYADALVHAQLVGLMRIMLLSPIVLGLSNLFGVFTQMRQKFVLHALAPILYNIGIILGITILYPVIGISGLVWGVILGAIGHVSVQLPAMREMKFIPHIKKILLIDWKTLGEIVASAFPRTITLAMHTILWSVLFVIVSKFGEGTLSLMKFANTLATVPITLIGVSLSVAAFPRLVDLYEQKTQEAHEKFWTLVYQAFERIIFWSLPAVTIFILLRAQIVRLLLGTGLFGWGATKITAMLLGVLVLAVFARSLTNLLLRVSYAQGYTWKPLVCNASGVVLALVLALFATTLHQVAFAYVVGATISSILLAIFVCRQHIPALWNHKKALLKKAFVWGSSQVVLGGGILGGLYVYAAILPTDTVISLTIQSGVGLVIGALAWLVYLYGFKEKSVIRIVQKLIRV